MYVIIGYFYGGHEAQICFDGREPFITKDYFKAVSYAEELENHARILGDEAEFFIKKLTNPED